MISCLFTPFPSKKRKTTIELFKIKITWGLGLANRQQMDFLFFEEKYKKPKIIPFINIVIILFDAGGQK